jgi:hypothetical protein
MSSGYLLRQEQAMDHRSAVPCPDCGHPLSVHREYPTDDARYQPLLFRCRINWPVECECEYDGRRGDRGAG